MDETVRWSLTVSAETDREIRSRLGKAGRRRDALSQFVERAVQRQLLAQTIAAVRARNASVSRRVIGREIDEAVRAVRASRGRARSRRSA
jgi:hypothetical protein